MRILTCILSLLLSFSAYADESKFVLLLGPSGTGKSTIIRHLKEMDSSFVYVSPYTTRELRPGETDKIHVDVDTIKQLEEEGKLLTINEIYGIFYATPKETISEALAHGNYPILDWPVDKIDIMISYFGDQLLTIYIEPESIEELERRLGLDGRDKDGKRFAAGKLELEKYYQGTYDAVIDLKIVNRNGEDKNVASAIYQFLHP